jgi:hypothetical protein
MDALMIRIVDVDSSVRAGVSLEGDWEHIVCSDEQSNQKRSENLNEFGDIQRSPSPLKKFPFYRNIYDGTAWDKSMSDADTASSSGSSSSDVDDDVARINMRIPQRKYEWLQEELDSFTSDTARLQYLIQFYSDHKEDDTGCS